MFEMANDRDVESNPKSKQATEGLGTGIPFKAKSTFLVSALTTSTFSGQVA